MCCSARFLGGDSPIQANGICVRFLEESNVNASCGVEWDAVVVAGRAEGCRGRGTLGWGALAHGADLVEVCVGSGGPVLVVVLTVCSRCFL